MTITVKRRRQSVTQGIADIFIDDKKVMSFADTIEIINPDEKYYGEIIGGWASKIPDTQFIIGMLNHPYDEVYHFSDRVEDVLNEVLTDEIQADGNRRKI